MAEVAFKRQPSVHAARQAREVMIGAPVTSLHNKLNGLEPATTAGLARFAATESAALVAEQAAPAPADAPPAPTATFPERTLWLHRVQTREEGRALYFRDNALIPDGYSLLCYLLRAVRADRVTRVDVKLIHLLFGMQAWMRAVGIRQPRRPAPHLAGRAADFAVEGIPSAVLARFAARFGAGWVGVYPTFVYVDTGPVRAWTG